MVTLRSVFWGAALLHLQVAVIVHELLAMEVWKRKVCSV